MKYDRTVQTKAEHQRARRDRAAAPRSISLQPQMAELPLHHVDRADQQHDAEHRRQMAEPSLTMPRARLARGMRSGRVGRAGKRRLGSARSSRGCRTARRNRRSADLPAGPAAPDTGSRTRRAVRGTDGACRPRRRRSGSSRLGVRRQRRQRLREVCQRRALESRRAGGSCFVGPDEVAVIGDGVIHQLGQQRLGLGRGAGAVAADEAPQHVRRLGVHHAGQIQQHGERHRAAAMVRQPAGVDVPGRIGRLLVGRLGRASRRWPDTRRRRAGSRRNTAAWRAAAGCT